MKKLFLTITFIGSSFITSAQVGVGTSAPKAVFQVNKSPVATVADGVLVPRVSVAELNAKASTYNTDQHGALVFVTAFAGAANETSNVTTTGFHFYNSTTDKWVAVSAPQVTVPYQNIKGGVVFINAANIFSRRK